MIVSVTMAQHRMLRRLARGEQLPTHRYKHVTVNALLRKGLAQASKVIARGHRGLVLDVWAITELGRRVCAARRGRCQLVES